MINRRHNGILYFILLFCISFGTSCTYDYFEDESNYVIYVPKADFNQRTDDYKVDQLSIFVYNNDLEKERYSSYPFEENARSRFGNYNFKLSSNKYSVYCFTNTSDVSFIDLATHSTARFDLKQSADGYYQEPPVIMLDTMRPLIHYPGPVIIDTAYLETKYVGRICFVFKNLTDLHPALSKSNIKKIELIAGGIGVSQYLANITDSTETRSSRKSTSDKMFLTPVLYDNPFQEFDFGFANYYFPSPDIDDLEPIHMELHFIGGNNQIITRLNVEISDRITGKPIPLHMNETLIVKIDGNNVQILNLKNPADWESEIENGEDDNPGGGGIEV